MIIANLFWPGGGRFALWRQKSSNLDSYSYFMWCITVPGYQLSKNINCHHLFENQNFYPKVLDRYLQSVGQICPPPARIGLIKILTTPKLNPKKTMTIIAFRITLTLDVKIVWFGRQVTVCVQKRHKNAIFGYSLFKSSTLTFYCLSSWFIHQKLKPYLNMCVLCSLIHLLWFQGPKYIPPYFWLQVII